MKKIYKLFALGASILLVSGVASCGSTEVDYDSSNFLLNGTESNPYQIVKKPVTIKIFAPHSSGNPEYKDLEMFKHLSKVTNLNFEFTTPDISAYTNTRSAVWDSGTNFPDLFLFNNSISEQVQFMEANYNAYIPLNDSAYSYNSNGNKIEVGNIIDNYMPFYKKGLEDNFSVNKEKSNASKVATLSDGKMYSTLSVKDVARDLTFKMFINDKWITNLNDNYLNENEKLPLSNEIKTIEQYLTILRAFKKYDANDNGDPNDEIPVSSKSLEYLRNFILSSYGYVSPSCEINNNHTAYEYVPYTEAYRKYLQFANTLYKEGLLHNSTFSITTDAQLAKYGMKNKLGSFVSAAAYITVGYDYEAAYKTFGPLTSSYYNGAPIQYGLPYFTADGATIPQKSKYVREVARLLDIMYSPLGTELISYGVEGKNWTWEDAEKTSWKFNVPTEWDGNQEQYRATITPNVGSASALYWKNDFVSKMNDPIIKNLNKMSEIYLPYLKIAEPTEIKMNSKEYAQVTKIKAALDPQLGYLEASFIRGENGSDPFNNESYNSFISKLKGYKADDLLKCYNDALARYNSGK